MGEEGAGDLKLVPPPARDHRDAQLHLDCWFLGWEMQVRSNGRGAGQLDWGQRPDSTQQLTFKSVSHRKRNCTGYCDGISKQVPHLLMENTGLIWLRSPANLDLCPSHQILLEAHSEKKLQENGLEDLLVGLWREFQWEMAGAVPGKRRPPVCENKTSSHKEVNTFLLGKSL